MGNNVAARQDYELLELMQQTCHAMERVRENELREVGLSMMHVAVLEIVGSAKVPVTPAKISRWMFREPHSVAGLLNRMEKEGLIRRVKDLERRNWVRVEITEKGEEAYRRSLEVNGAQEIISSLLPGERGTLQTYVKTLQNKAIEKLREQVGRGYRLFAP